MKSIFGNRLVELRKENKLTRAQLAEIFQMSVNTLRNYETGEREPGHSFLIKVAEKFNVSIDYLLGYDYKKESPASNDAEDSIENYSERLYDLLVDAGIVNEGQPLTPAEVKFLRVQLRAIASYFDEP